jgi:hypothetical protein
MACMLARMRVPWAPCAMPLPGGAPCNGPGRAGRAMRLRGASGSMHQARAPHESILAVGPGASQGPGGAAKGSRALVSCRLGRQAGMPVHDAPLLMHARAPPTTFMMRLTQVRPRAGIQSSESSTCRVSVVVGPSTTRPERPYHPTPSDGVRGPVTCTPPRITRHASPVACPVPQATTPRRLPSATVHNATALAGSAACYPSWRRGGATPGDGLA